MLFLTFSFLLGCAAFGTGLVCDNVLVDFRSLGFLCVCSVSLVFVTFFLLLVSLGLFSEDVEDGNLELCLDLSTSLLPLVLCTVFSCFTLLQRTSSSEDSVKGQNSGDDETACLRLETLSGGVGGLGVPFFEFFEDVSGSVFFVANLFSVSVFLLTDVVLQDPPPLLLGVSTGGAGFPLELTLSLLDLRSWGLTPLIGSSSSVVDPHPSCPAKRWKSLSACDL